LLYFSSWGDSDIDATRLYVSDGSVFTWTSGEIHGPGRVDVRPGGQADLTNVEFVYVDHTSSTWRGGPKVTYEAGSSGSADNANGQWDLDIEAGTLVSVTNGIEVTNLSIAEVMVVDSGSIGVLSVSASASITNSEIEYVNLNGGTSALSGNTITSSAPLRTADPDHLNTSLITGNTFSGADPVVYVEGTLDYDEIFEVVDGQLRVYELTQNLRVAAGATLTVEPGVTLRSVDRYDDIVLYGVLEGMDSSLELPYFSSWGDSDIDATRLYVSNGSVLSWTGGQISGPGRVDVRHGGQADLTDVEFVYVDHTSSTWRGGPKVTYEASSLGVVSRCSGNLDLSIRSPRIDL